MKNHSLDNTDNKNNMQFTHFLTQVRLTSSNQMMNVHTNTARLRWRSPHDGHSTARLNRMRKNT